MQSIIDTARNAASAVTSTVAPAHHHSEEDHAKSLPADATAGPIKSIDEEGLLVFEDDAVRHEVLVKIRKLALEDERHGLGEVAALNLTDAEGEIKKAGQYYHPKRYFTVTRATGTDYIGEVEIEEGKSIHIRAHKAGAAHTPTFHSIDTRPSDEGGAVFKTGEALVWFDY
ncbi:hypothetical protein B9479_002031 [Cryptococcus floricola]|uniref:Uncharacterized protein n=1 Tax=Cryptococcus floricola TaxID=2591691 RepID=A0A5D3B2Q0_9TREE|nr:hypothetical protein B9479_002031 [Cryptococcus floricola]